MLSEVEAWQAIGASVASLGLIEGTADAASSFVKLGAGYHSDKIGHRKTWTVVGYALTAGAMALFTFAFAWPLILLGRVIGWFGKGIRGPLRDAMLADFAPTLMILRATTVLEPTLGIPGYCHRHAHIFLGFGNGLETVIMYKDLIQEFFKCIDGARRTAVRAKARSLRHPSLCAPRGTRGLSYGWQASCDPGCCPPMNF